MKQNDCVKRIFIIIGLVFLMISAFIIRQHNFEYSPARSIDEVVYFRMAVQIQDGLENYNTIPYGKKLQSSGRKLPDYFFKPLYKHPPIFTLFVSLAIKLFGFSEVSAFYVPVFFSLLMIPLIYCLGTLVFNRTVGFLSAILISLDPMSIVCSQKIWMESTIAFFTVFSIYAFVKALKTSTPRLFISSGILSGLGALTKYTGGISTLIFVVYAFFFDKKLYKDKYFLVSLLIPVVMLVPWLLWNVSVYGLEFFGMQVNMHSDKHHAGIFGRNIVLYVIFGLALLRLAKKIHDDLPNKAKASKNIFLVSGCGFAVLLWPAVLKSFTIMHLPLTSWAGSTFYGATHLFYLQRELEFSLISFFAFLAFFIPKKNISGEEQILRLSSAGTLLFFTIWSAFQCRYIIAANPLLILIGVNFLYELFQKTHAILSFGPRVLVRSGILIIAFMILLKVLIINYFISFPNNLCYF
ncbi:MAG: ArnT family glycosyltransferase [Candidatus Omnitrophota bacterium]